MWSRACIDVELHLQMLYMWVSISIDVSHMYTCGGTCIHVV